MIVLVGTQEKAIKNGILENSVCPNCNGNVLHFSIYGKYTHLTLIPLFPVGKEIYFICPLCNEQSTFEDLNDEDKLIVTTLKKETIFPIWMFIGIITLILVVIFFVKTYVETNNTNAEFIKKQEIGDVYYLKLENGYYTSMKIHFKRNEYDAYLPYEIEELDLPENYNNIQVIMTKKDLLQQYNNDKVIKIIRNHE
jgi:hypothetical protein